MIGAATHDVRGTDLIGVFERRRLHQLFEWLERVLVEAIHALGLVGHHQRTLAQRVLRGDTGRTSAGVALLRLDAAERT